MARAGHQLAVPAAVHAGVEHRARLDDVAEERARGEVPHVPVVLRVTRTESPRVNCALAWTRAASGARRPPPPAGPAKTTTRRARRAGAGGPSGRTVAFSV